MLHKLTETFIPVRTLIAACRATPIPGFGWRRRKPRSTWTAWPSGRSHGTDADRRLSLFNAMRPTPFGAPADHMLPLLRAVHGAGVACRRCSRWCAFRTVKVVEPYRSTCSPPSCCWRVSSATSCCSNSSTIPGSSYCARRPATCAARGGGVPAARTPAWRAAGRFERMMGASVWLRCRCCSRSRRPCSRTPALCVPRQRLVARAARPVRAGDVLVVEQWALRWSLAHAARRSSAHAALLWIVLTCCCWWPSPAGRAISGRRGAARGPGRAPRDAAHGWLPLARLHRSSPIPARSPRAPCPLCRADASTPPTWARAWRCSRGRVRSLGRPVGQGGDRARDGRRGRRHGGHRGQGAQHAARHPHRASRRRGRHAGDRALVPPG